ncbi:MAG: acetate--CoA ligase [Proteobacteria bacterium]|nr:acetate--CoA ligase [Pseudomonadota bacterium]
MTDTRSLFSVPAALKHTAHLDDATYQRMYRQSVEKPDAFWAEMANTHLTWIKKWDTVSQCDYHTATIKWFSGGVLNVSENCIDRHLPDRANQTALIWEPDSPSDDAKHITYQELYNNVTRLANTLKADGVKRGDRVCIYMPMIPEAAYAMLACARIGAIHSVVFGGFSAESLRGRIDDAGCAVVITADEGRRGGKHVPLKATVDEAVHGTKVVRRVFVVKNTGSHVSMKAGRDVWLHDAMAKQSTNCPPEPMGANDPLFILYTSGSTGKPKGVVHGTGGYLLYATMTHKYVFDYHEDDIYWCTADVGWITGHSYIVYGPLANGATSVMFEGIPSWPDASRFWQVVERHKVNIFYTAPTAIRALHAQGDDWVKNVNRSSLRILGSVGEPINPEAWLWYYDVIGDGRCPIVDTWWQTETGGILITPLPGATDLKPGSATRPFFGVQPMLVNEHGRELEGAAEGLLCISASWPGQMQTVYGDHERFKQTYFTHFAGLYFTGDGAKRDKDGYYWITGRVDDVLNVSGHRMGTAEVESAIVLHDLVAEAAVVGYPHDIKGQGIYAYVTLNVGVEPTDDLRKEVIALVRKEIGPIATPDIIQWAPRLPKTRSGKIMRRILRKIAENDIGAIGDVSTLAEPDVVKELIANRPLK